MEYAIGMVVGLIVGLALSKAYRQPTDRRGAFKVMLADTLLLFKKEYDAIPVGDTHTAQECVERAYKAVSTLKSSYEVLMPWENFYNVNNEIFVHHSWLRYKLSTGEEGFRPTVSP